MEKFGTFSVVAFNWGRVLLANEQTQQENFSVVWQHNTSGKPEYALCTA